ncbi:uncharacterized protein LOC130985638 [Salvia miltiorrhiza]|uniref:uncharacterized protein LOC130985638 n=1 Tax=Salvia miltiorrhiza TaxID=226208 RepID=UPI0025ACD5BB|nr:uncharacterized protein LOC130985638 [Salvia miltiorrhiza]
MPCCHALVAFYYSKMDPMSIMSQWYHKTCFMKCYEHSIQLVPRRKFWKVKESDAVEPPPVDKKIGKPQKMRVSAPNELRRSHKLSRKGQKQHCSICKSESHKKNDCPQRPTQVTQDTQASTSSHPTKLKTRRGSKGIGLYINPESGRTVLNPGMSQTVVIDEGTPRDTDLNTRFPIPNERELRKEKRKQIPTKGEGETSNARRMA